jgi:hypothetical protein
MSFEGLTQIIARMLVAGGPERQPARVRWPLHLALRELYAETGLRGQRQLLDSQLEQRPSSSVGVETVGADRALDELVQAGLLRPEGSGRAATLVVDEDAAILVRRELMSLAPARVALLYNAGQRWAALVSTALKNRSTASRSSASTVSSSTPNRAKAAEALEA